MTYKQRLAKATQAFNNMKNSGLYNALRDIDLINTLALSLEVGTDDLKRSCGA